MSKASVLEWQMLSLINEERTSRGLEPLELELRLNAAAEDHSDWMLSENVFSHTGIDGSSPGDRMRDADFEFSGGWTWAENIAWQSERGEPGLADDVIDLHTSLMNSPGHRANILNPNVTVVGIGIEIGDYNGWDAVMVTQKFADTAAALRLDARIVDDGTMGDDVLALSDAGTLTGYGGNDRLTGSTGTDTLNGGAGNDSISASGGSDMLRGGNGADNLNGGGGDDVLAGGGGNDRIIGGGGDDRLAGNAGNDTFVFTSGRDVVRDYEATGRADVVNLRLATGITDFADLSAHHISARGNHVIIRDGDGDAMVLRDVAIADLDANDFIF